MVVFPIGIKLADDLPVQRPHDANPRKHRRAAGRRDQDQGLHCRLPVRGFVLGFRKLRNVLAGVLQRDELAAAGQWNWFVEKTFPAFLLPDGQRRNPPIEAV
jgi:hypothetical protein